MADIYDIPGFGGITTVNITIDGGIVPHGVYDPIHAYISGDSVSYEGSSYIALQNTTGDLPTDTTYWQLLSGGIEDAIKSATTSGEYRVDNIKIGADGKIVVTYDDVPHA